MPEAPDQKTLPQILLEDWLRLSRELSGGPGPSAIMQQVGQSLKDALGLKVLFLSLYDPELGAFRPLWSHGVDRPAELMADPNPLIATQLLADGFRKSECYLIGAADPVWQGMSGSRFLPGLGAGQLGGNGDVMLCPILGMDQNLLGLITVVDRDLAVSLPALDRYLPYYARMAGGAVEKGLLYLQREESSSFNRVLIQTVERLEKVNDPAQLWRTIADNAGPALRNYEVAVSLANQEGNYFVHPLVMRGGLQVDGLAPVEDAWLEKVLSSGPQSELRSGGPGQLPVLRQGWPMEVDGLRLGVLTATAASALDHRPATDFFRMLSAQVALALNRIRWMSLGAVRQEVMESYFKGSQDPLIITGPLNQVVFANAPAREMMAGRPEELKSLALGPDDRKWLLEQSELLSSGAAAEAERKVVLKDSYSRLRLKGFSENGKFSGCLIHLHDLRQEGLEYFRELTGMVAALDDIELLPQILLKAVRHFVDFDSGAVLLREKGDHFRFLASQGTMIEHDSGAAFRLKSGLAEAAINEGRTLSFAGAEGSMAESLGITAMEKPLSGARALLVTPLFYQKHNIGLLVLANNRPESYPQISLSLIDEMSPGLARILWQIGVAGKLKQENSLRNKLYEIGFASGSVLQVGSLLNLMIRTIAKELKLDDMGIYFFDEVLGEWNGKSIMPAGKDGGFLGIMKSADIKLDYQRLSEIREINAAVICRGQAELVPDIKSDPRFPDGACHPELNSGLWLPLKLKDKAIGSMYAMSRHPAYFGHDDMLMLQELAPLVTFALRSAILYEEIRREGSRVGAIINSMPEGLLMVDSSFRVITNNEGFEKLWGLKHPIRPGDELKNDILGLLTESLVNPRPLIEFFQGCAVSATGVVPPAEVELKEGRHLKIISFPVEELGRPRTGLVILTQDITTEHQIAELRQEFVGMLSHDLRNPLAAIIATLELSLDGSLGELNENQQQFLSNAMNDSRRMLEMLNDFLDGYKYEAVELKLEKTSFDISQLVARLVADFSPLAREKSIDLLEESPGAILVTADETKLARVVSNLLSNALKFTPKGGRILVRVKEAGEYIEVSVADNGEGIAKEDLAKVFEKFYQVEKRRRGRKTGTGLGLSLCKKLVEAHQGRIWVESQPGKGSTFIFTLPK